jgi:ectoine hydroxylase-related dioxygenase (phytanoyl-CoA dioxygenase family)
MSPQEVRSIAPRVITASQRESYFENGFLNVEGAVSPEWLDRLNTALEEVLARSRGVTESDRNFVLEKAGQSQERRLRRLNHAADNHPVFWEFMSSPDSVLPDIVADLIGPDVKFRESMINFKLARGGEEVKWHQDTSYLYTNDTPIICCINFADVTMEQGPLVAVAGSHKLGQLDRYDERGNWAGHISEADMKKVELSKATSLPCPAGSVTLLHQYVVHGSPPNNSAKNRALMVVGYDAGDSVAIRPTSMVNQYTGVFVRGQQPDYVRVEHARLRLPPDWTKPEHLRHAMSGIVFGDKAPTKSDAMM